MSDSTDNINNSVALVEPPREEHAEMKKRYLNHNIPYLILMNNYRKEIFLIVLIIARIVLTAIEKSIPVISPVPSSEPLFPYESNVRDWYNGHLEGALSEIGSSEYSFVMYYAPWDAKSQYSVKIIDDVAALLKDQISFLAINCWEPESECREKYAIKVQAWPVLVLLNSYGHNMQYKGPLSKPHLTRFLNTALNPLHRIINSDDIIELMAQFDAVVVGYVDMADSPSGYNILHKTALKWLEHEPFNEVGFGVVTGQTAIELGVNHFPAFRIYLWNETLEYPADKPVNASELFSWILSNLHQVSMWLNLPGYKSSTINPYLMQGSALLLFTPRNVFRDNNDAYDMLKQLGLEYYNCNNDPWIKQLSQYIEMRRNENMESYYEKLYACKEILAPEKCSKVESPCKKVPVSITISKWMNSSKEPNIKYETCPKNSKKFCDNIYTSIDNMDQDLFPIQKCRVRGDLKYEDVLTYKNFTEDLYSAKNLIAYKAKQQCLLLQEAEMFHEPVFLDNEANKGIPDITGLACRTNHSLSLLAIDSNMFHFVAERLGVDILRKANKTTVILIDREYEYQSILKGNVNPSSVKQLIWNHSKKIEIRSFRNNAMDNNFTHHYKLPPKEPYESNKKKDIHKSPKSGPENRNLGIITVPEINSISFASRVMKSNKTIVVLYYSPYCGFCQRVWHIFLYVKRLLSSCPEISFVRFDMDNNDMPWQLTMDDLPTITLFPERKSESSTFPASLDITVPNLLAFVLSKINGSMRLGVILEVCEAVNQSSEQQTTCWLELQHETLRLIEISLKQWRSSSNYMKVVLLRRLQLLKSLSLFLLSNPKEITISRLNSIKKVIRQLNLNTIHRNNDNLKKAFEDLR